MTEKTTLRARDFLASLVLLSLSLFFLWRTSHIPLFDDAVGGVRIGGWYNSAALVPLGLFSALLILSLILMLISIKEGGARRAFSAVGLGFDRRELWRLTSLALIAFFYIFALVPRVDFVISSALVMMALVYGYHRGSTVRMFVSVVVMSTVGSYALVMHFPQSEWAKPHDDDIVALIGWITLVLIGLITARTKQVGWRNGWMMPLLSVLVPLILVCAMAFGFRQNVPNRSGLLFSQIEYHYYVTLRPIWSK